MRILVLNGSPKGNYSTTLHTCLYLSKLYAEHTWEVLHVGQRIKSLEQKPEEWKKQIKEADMLLFCYPVYTFLVPSQLHRFVELMKADEELMAALRGKLAIQISTSMHFYDITANRWVEENAGDMGLTWLGTLSAGMEDLLSETGRKQAEEFFRMVLWKAEKPEIRGIEATKKVSSYIPHPAAEAASTEKQADKRVAVITDLQPDDAQLAGMIDRFRAVMPYDTDLYNIAEFPFKGGCISCFRCSSKGKCFYSDHFDTYLREEIQQKHDSIVYAFRIKDHSMGSLFKTFDDRQFCNGHRTVTMGMPFAYIVEGAYSEELNLQMVLNARSEVGGNYLAGVASDEGDTNLSIDKMADELAYALKHNYTQPQNFLGVGGMKIFRDLIYQMRGMMRADHKFFKAHGQYDFPQKRWKTSWMMYLVGGMMGNEKVRKKMGNKMNEGMIAAYRKVVDNA